VLRGGHIEEVGRCLPVFLGCIFVRYPVINISYHICPIHMYMRGTLNGMKALGAGYWI
jgi:hypothetical protein